MGIILQKNKQKHYRKVGLGISLLPSSPSEVPTNYSELFFAFFLEVIKIQSFKSQKEFLSINFPLLSIAILPTVCRRVYLIFTLGSEFWQAA